MTPRLPLAEGEALIWQGAPDPRRSGRAYLVHALIGAVLAGAGMAGIVMVTMPLALAVAFAGIGLLFLGLPWIMRRLASQTRVAITGTRVMVMRRRRGGNGVRWARYEDIAAVICHARPDGSGDLLIRHRDPAENDVETGLWESLFGLPEIARVETEIRRRRTG